MPKFTLAELKKKREELAIRCMKLQDALYENRDNQELRFDYEDAEDEYQYLCKLIERREPATKKYLITIAKLTYGNIEVEGIDREDAKAKALSLANKNCDNVQWFDNASYRVAEVYKNS